MVVIRDTFIREGDIADGQLDDLHPKTGTHLRKLVDKIVIDDLFLTPVAVGFGDTLVRLDQQLLDKIPSPDSVTPGILTDRGHKIFKFGLDAAFPDSFNKQVTGNIVFAPPISFQITLTALASLGTTVGPLGDVQIGDTMRVEGQTLTSTYLTKILNKVPNGPNFDLTFDAPFVQGGTGTYNAERVSRWTLNFVDSTSAPFVMPTATLDIGIQARVFLSDTTTTFGRGLLNAAQFPRISGSGVDVRDIFRYSLLHKV